MKITYNFIFILFLSSCAASMSLTPKPTPSVEDIGIGSTMTDVESILGINEKAIVIDREHKTFLYRFKTGGKPNIPRSVAHGGLTVATKGIWELVAIPFEEYTHRDKFLVVTFNEHDIVIDIKEIEAPKKIN